MFGAARIVDMPCALIFFFFVIFSFRVLQDARGAQIMQEDADRNYDYDARFVAAIIIIPASCVKLTRGLSARSNVEKITHIT